MPLVSLESKSEDLMAPRSPPSTQITLERSRKGSSNQETQCSRINLSQESGVVCCTQLEGRKRATDFVEAPCLWTRLQVMCTLSTKSRSAPTIQSMPNLLLREWHEKLKSTSPHITQTTGSTPARLMWQIWFGRIKASSTPELEPNGRTERRKVQSEWWFQKPEH